MSLRVLEQKASRQMMPWQNLKRINKKICHSHISARENIGMTDMSLREILKNFNVINLIYYGLYKIALVKVT